MLMGVGVLVVGVGQGMTVRRWSSLTFGPRGPQGVVGRRGWRPRTTVGFAGPGKSIAGGNVSTSAAPPLVDGACCASPLRKDGLVCGGVCVGGGGGSGGVGGGGRVEWGPLARAVGVPRK